MKIKDFIKNISTLQEGQRIRITFFKDKIPILWGKQEIDTIFKKWEYEDEEMKNIYIYIYIYIYSRMYFLFKKYRKYRNTRGLKSSFLIS